MDLANIGYKANTNAGIGVTIYFACLSEIDTDAFPDLRTDGNVYENAIQTDSTQNITFPTAGDGFISISALMPDKSSSELTYEGDKGSKSASGNLNVILTGTDVEVKGFVELVKNEPGVLLWNDECGGPVNMLGSPCYPAFMSEATVSSGAAPGDARQADVTFNASGKPILEYTGTITVKA